MKDWYYRDTESLRKVPWHTGTKFAVEVPKFVGETLHIEIAELVCVQDGCSPRMGVRTPEGKVYCVPNMSCNTEFNIGDVITVTFERYHVPHWRLVT